MAEFDFDEQRSVRFHKNVGSERGSRREINLRSISGRNIFPAENDAALGGEVRNNFFAVGKIPFPDGRLNTAAINRTLRRKHDVDRHRVHVPFKVSAKNPGEMIRGKDASGPAAAVKELRVVGFSQADSAAAEKPKLPSSFLTRIH